MRLVACGDGHSHLTRIPDQPVAGSLLILKAVLGWRLDAKDVGEVDEAL
jgi:hypothetical protein